MSLYSLTLLVSAVQALPAGSFYETSIDTSAEASCSDSHRSLWNIISTCLLTAFACVYTAVHPNVPSPYDSPFVRLRRAALIILVAVFAPELIVVWAARQWVSACAFTKDMKKCLALRSGCGERESASIQASGVFTSWSTLSIQYGMSGTREENGPSGEPQRSGGSAGGVPMIGDDAFGNNMWLASALMKSQLHKSLVVLKI